MKNSWPWKETLKLSKPRECIFASAFYVEIEIFRPNYSHRVWQHTRLNFDSRFVANNVLRPERKQKTIEGSNLTHLIIYQPTLFQRFLMNIFYLIITENSWDQNIIRLSSSLAATQQDKSCAHSLTVQPSIGMLALFPVRVCCMSVVRAYVYHPSSWNFLMNVFMNIPLLPKVHGNYYSNYNFEE